MFKSERYRVTGVLTHLFEAALQYVSDYATGTPQTFEIVFLFILPLLTATKDLLRLSIKILV